MNKTFLTWVLLAISGASSAFGATLVSFEFPATDSLVANVVAGNLTASNFALSSGTIETNRTTGTYFVNSPYIEESAGWTAVSQSAAKSFNFTLSAAPGYRFNVTNVSFGAYSTNAGPSAFGLSLNDGNQFAVNAPNSALVSVNQSFSLSAVMSMTFKIQGWLNGSRVSTGGGAFRLDDVIVIGTVTAIPEPSSVTVLLGSLALTGVVGLRRRRRF